MSADKKKCWFKLDNAGKLYPAIATSRWNSVFRLSVVLREDIVPEALQSAVNKVLPRFPTMAVCMRQGFFWYYLEANEKPLLIQADKGHPCLRFRWKADNGYLMRVLYYRRRISVEFFHSITDGMGGFAFLKTLAAEYLRFRGICISPGEGVLDLKTKPSTAEMEDTFQRIPLPRFRLPRRTSRAYQLPGVPEPRHTLHVVAASMPFAAVSALAKSLNVTVTEYLAAVLLHVSYKQQQEDRSKLRPVRISVPVNLRNYFPTETLRNFSSFINPEIDPRMGEYTFEEIARNLRDYMRYALNPKLLFAGIAANVADERKLFLRLCPLPLKNLVIHAVFWYSGERAVTTTLTNVGRICAPAQMMAHVERFEAMLGAAATRGSNCAMASTDDTTTLVFTRNQRDATLVRETLRFLVNQGVPVCVESNQE